MKYDFDEIIDRHGTDCQKWDRLEKVYPGCPDDAIAMWVADMDFACAPCIVEALRKRVDERIYGYSCARNPEYYRIVAQWMKDRHGWEVDVDDIVFSPGVVPAIGYLINILTQPGDGVIVQGPVYFPFLYMIEGNGRTIANNPLVLDGSRYVIDFEDLEEKLRDDRNKLLLFCSPHNPVGRVWTKDELSRVAELCEKYGKLIISDEIHFDLVRKGVTHTVLETVRPAYKEKIITCTAPSKTFNLAGLQNSNIVIHDQAILAKWQHFLKHVAHTDGHNFFGAAANAAAYREGGPWLDQLNDYLDGNITFLTSYMSEHMTRAKVIPCEGTYLVWVDLSGYGLAQEELDKLLVEKAGVLLDSGTMFGEAGRGFQRFNVACPRAVLAQALERIERVLEA